MIHQIKHSISRHLSNLPGWRTNRKIIVFESDDWGSIRMPSSYVYNSLLKSGVRVDRCPYNRLDSLASEEDLSALFDVLVKFIDHLGNHPVITANTVTANPDFEKIKEARFQEYYYERFTDTLKKYSGRKKSFDIWRQGMNSGIFHPQFHGREHLNVNRWMKALKTGSEETLLAFKFNMFGISTNISNEIRKSYMAAFDFDEEIEIKDHLRILNEGLILFNEIFGFKSNSFIAPNYIWHNFVEQELLSHGIKVIQGAGRQNVPTKNGIKLVKHQFGSRNINNQLYLKRNCLFEPSYNQNGRWVNSVLKEIAIAFNWGKPAVICSHRLNYIGSIDIENRRMNLLQLEELLKNILFKWPDVEFMSSDKLGLLIEMNQKK